MKLSTNPCEDTILGTIVYNEVFPQSCFFPHECYVKEDGNLSSLTNIHYSFMMYGDIHHGGEECHNHQHLAED